MEGACMVPEVPVLKEPTLRDIVKTRFDLREDELPHRADLMQYARNWRAKPGTMLVKLVKALLTKDEGASK